MAPPAPVAPAPPPAAQPSTTTAKPATVGKTKEAAIQRYEQLLHAIGTQDIAVTCEIAGPAAKKAEDQGFGPCASTFPVMFGMIPPDKKKILQTTTVDPAKVTARGADFDIPAAAVRPSGTFAEDELGVSVLSYRNGNWFVID